MLLDLVIKDTTFKVGVADNEILRYKGLSNTPSLGNRKGLLFAYPSSGLHTMVMRDMNYPLDFLFLDKNWSIVDLGSLNNDPDNYITTENPALYVVELNKGVIEELDLKVGDTTMPSPELLAHVEPLKKYENGGSFEMIGEKIIKPKVVDVKPEPGKLHVLNDRGEVVMNITPGARIFSREHTKALIEGYKKGSVLDLADMIIEIYDIHDKQKPDYVKK